MNSRQGVSEQQSSKPFIQFGLKYMFVLLAVVGVFLAITVAFGQFALMMLPMVLLLGLFLVAVRWLGAWESTLFEILIVLAIIYLVVSCLASGCVDPLGPARCSECRNNLEQIALALHDYHDEYGSLPPAYVADRSGRPMHSWRVLLLPFLEQEALYEQYDFSEPWDGPNNRRLAGVCVLEYVCPEESRPRLNTSYVAVVGPGTLWPGVEAKKLADVSVGTSKTLMIAETVNSGIHWMEPRDLQSSALPLEVNPADGRGISSLHPRDKWGRTASLQAYVAFADGRVEALTNGISCEELGALLTIAPRTKPSAPTGNR